MSRVWKVFAVLLLLGGTAFGTIFGTVRGIVHDPQHRPLPSAQVVLKAKSSEYTQTTQTDSEGQFHFDAVPIGEYIIDVTDPAFAAARQNVTVFSGTAPVLHFELAIATQSQSVEVSIQEALVATTLYDFVAFSYAGFLRKRSGRQFHLGYPNLVTLPCADGYVGFHAGLPQHIHNLLELAGRPDLAAEPRFNSLATIGAQAKELHGVLEPWLKTRGKWEVFHTAQKRGIPTSPIPTPDEVVNWTHLKERQAFIEVEHPEGGTVKIPGPPFREQGKLPWSLRRAPLLGEHTEAVLCGQLGYSKEDLERMRNAGII